MDTVTCYHSHADIMLRRDFHKAPGPDTLSMSNWLLSDFTSHPTGPVCAIYNMSVRAGFMPSLWKEANFEPALKVRALRAIESDLTDLTASLKVLEPFVISILTYLSATQNNRHTHN